MKHVKISKFHKEKDHYVVFLGNGTAHKFQQERQALRFLSVTSKFLTKNLYDLRYVFGQIQLQYNRNWAYFLHDKKTMSSKKSMDDLFCKETLASIQHQFDLIIERCDYTNGNYFAFQKCNVIISDCKSVILKLDRLHKSKSNAVDRFEYDALFDRLTYIETKLNSYSQREAIELFQMPMHLDDKKEYIPVLQISA